MSERDRYIAGVPCWIDTSRPDPQVAVQFYGGLFGWKFEDVMPAGADGQYLIARLGGGDVGAVASETGAAPGLWNSYVWVEDADATTAKVLEAGGTVLTETVDAPAGRSATFADPSGASFSIWQAKAHRGAQVINEHGSVTFNDLHTRDLEGAKRFYGSVFGWRTLALGGEGEMWTLTGYGEYLEVENPGMIETMAEMGVAGFEDAVASLNPIPEDQSDLAPHWGVTFGVDDADSIAEQAVALGGRVIVPPFDAPWVRKTVIADPEGVVFTASKFVPENKDVDTVETAASAA